MLMKASTLHPAARRRMICRLTPRKMPGCSEPIALPSTHIFQPHGERAD
jgi:hypothetical protein